MRIKVGVILSGCGFLDGSEIHEATLTLLFLDRSGAEGVCIASNINQSDVIDHFTQKPTGQIRNVLTEASRISRGGIKNIEDVDTRDLGALIFPGGYGAVKNICDYASGGIDCAVNPEVDRIIREMHRDQKPLGFICIAPVIAAKVLGTFHPELTIGNDKATAGALRAMGARHKVCRVEEIVVDEKNRIISTPAYMLGPSISCIASGIEKLVLKVLEMIGK
jgi:enhancing lycopene biosynthesis protein 2